MRLNGFGLNGTQQVSVHREPLKLAEKVADAARNEGSLQRLLACKKANQWVEIWFGPAAGDVVTRLVVKNATLRGAEIAYASLAYVTASLVQLLLGHAPLLSPIADLMVLMDVYPAPVAKPTVLQIIGHSGSR